MREDFTCFMEILKDADTQNAFEGRLPNPGEVVELVCVNHTPEKMVFNLRVKGGAQ